MSVRGRKYHWENTRSMLWKCAVVSVVIFIVIPLCESHGRLLDPPSRASMWRLGFDSPADYDDHQGYCGGKDALWRTFEGRCGVCGDPYYPTPRAHEKGGQYYQGTPTQTYQSGSLISVTVGITANHRGWLEFRLCSYDDPQDGDIEYDQRGEFVEVTQDCLDRHLLTLEDGSTRYDLPEPHSSGQYTVKVQLPSGLSCSKCLFQWKWNVGNSWGTDPDGTSCVGCGEQEQFYACADVIIISGDGVEVPEDKGQSDKAKPRKKNRKTRPGKGKSKNKGKKNKNRQADGGNTTSNALPTTVPTTTTTQIPQTEDPFWWTIEHVPLFFQSTYLGVGNKTNHKGKADPSYDVPPTAPVTKTTNSRHNHIFSKNFWKWLTAFNPLFSKAAGTNSIQPPKGDKETEKNKGKRKLLDPMVDGRVYDVKDRIHTPSTLSDITKITNMFQSWWSRLSLKLNQVLLQGLFGEGDNHVHEVKEDMLPSERTSDKRTRRAVGSLTNHVIGSYVMKNFTFIANSNVNAAYPGTDRVNHEHQQKEESFRSLSDTDQSYDQTPAYPNTTAFNNYKNNNIFQALDLTDSNSTNISNSLIRNELTHPLATNTVSVNTKLLARNKDINDSENNRIKGTVTFPNGHPIALGQTKHRKRKERSLAVENITDPVQEIADSALVMEDLISFRRNIDTLTPPEASTTSNVVDNRNQSSVESVTENQFNMSSSATTPKLNAADLSRAVNNTDNSETSQGPIKSSTPSQPSETSETSNEDNKSYDSPSKDLLSPKHYAELKEGTGEKADKEANTQKMVEKNEIPTTTVINVVDTIQSLGDHIYNESNIEKNKTILGTILAEPTNASFLAFSGSTVLENNAINDAINDDAFNNTNLNGLVNESQSNGTVNSNRDTAVQTSNNQTEASTVSPKILKPILLKSSKKLKKRRKGRLISRRLSRKKVLGTDATIITNNYASNFTAENKIQQNLPNVSAEIEHRQESSFKNNLSTEFGYNLREPNTIDVHRASFNTPNVSNVFDVFFSNQAAARRLLLHERIAKVIASLIARTSSNTTNNESIPTKKLDTSGERVRSLLDAELPVGNEEGDDVNSLMNSDKKHQNDSGSRDSNDKRVHSGTGPVRGLVSNEAIYDSVKRNNIISFRKNPSLITGSTSKTCQCNRNVYRDTNNRKESERNLRERNDKAVDTFESVNSLKNTSVSDRKSIEKSNQLSKIVASFNITSKDKNINANSLVTESKVPAVTSESQENGNEIRLYINDDSNTSKPKILEDVDFDKNSFGIKEKREPFKKTTLNRIKDIASTSSSKLSSNNSDTSIVDNIKQKKNTNNTKADPGSKDDYDDYNDDYDDYYDDEEDDDDDDDEDYSSSTLSPSGLGPGFSFLLGKNNKGDDARQIFYTDNRNTVGNGQTFISTSDGTLNHNGKDDIGISSTDYIFPFNEIDNHSEEYLYFNNENDKSRVPSAKNPIDYQLR